METHTPSFDRADEAARLQRWLRDVMRQVGLKPTPLAKEAGISPSTLLRALDPANPTELDRSTIRKIVERFGVAPPELVTSPRGAGFREPEMLELEGVAPRFAGEDLTPNQYVRRVNTRALELVGVLPGDLLLLDMSLAPRGGDVVHAQIYGASGAAQSVLRLSQPPFVVTRSLADDVPAKPLLVDDAAVKVMAVMLTLVRQRNST